MDVGDLMGPLQEQYELLSYLSSLMYLIFLFIQYILLHVISLKPA